MFSVIISFFYFDSNDHRKQMFCNTVVKKSYSHSKTAFYNNIIPVAPHASSLAFVLYHWIVVCLLCAIKVYKRGGGPNNRQQ